jgi:hypothetical protein
MKDTINSEKSLYDHIDYLRSQFKEHKYLRVEVKTGKQRSPTQNRCVHLYCEQVAENLTDAGITFDMFFKPGFEVPWNKLTVKDNIWRPIQIAICDKVSTTEPLTTDYNEIYEYVNLKLAKYSIYVPWPSKESLNESNR